jgi:hypothetical protein
MNESQLRTSFAVSIWVGLVDGLVDRCAGAADLLLGRSASRESIRIGGGGVENGAEWAIGTSSTE